MKQKYLLVLILFCCLVVFFIKTPDKRGSLKNHYSSLEFLLFKGDSLYDLEEYYKAIPYYSKVLRLDSTVANAYFNRGNCFAFLHKYEMSSLDYLKSIELNWRLADSYFNLASNFVLQGKSDVALDYFRKAYYYNPNDEIAKEQIELIEILYNN